MNRQDLLFETSRFNLSEVKEHFINPCCYGEDAGSWLVQKLALNRVQAMEPDQEDWGWYTTAFIDGQHYFIGIGGNASEAAANKNHGEWRLMIQKRRSLWQRLFGMNLLTEDDKMVKVILEILGQEPEFNNIRLESNRT